MSHYKHGSWNAVCDRCGFEFKMYQLRKDWQGLMVCREDWEPRHEQDFIRTRPERGGVPISRPEPEDINILTACDFWSSSPMADFGTADCMTVGGNTSVDLLIETYGASSRAGIAIAGRSISGVL
jgi:hypothetical protein